MRRLCGKCARWGWTRTRSRIIGRRTDALDRVFLDANVLFSAAYRPRSGLTRLWQLESVRLLSSGYAIEEARRNLADPAVRSRLADLLVSVERVPEAAGRSLPPGIDLHPKDRPILLAAVGSGATHLLTGDFRHFGAYFGRTAAGVLILPPSAYLGDRGG